MIDLDRLEQRLDLALEAELRRHIGLDPSDSPAQALGSPPPASPPPSTDLSPPEPLVSVAPELQGPSGPTEREAQRPAPPSKGAEPVRPVRPARPPEATQPPPPKPPAPQLRVRDRRRTVSPLRKHAVRADITEDDGTPSSPQASLQRHARDVVDLIGQGRIREADVHIAAHATLATELDDADAKRAAAVWATMRALLDGRHRDARRGIDAMIAGAEEGTDAFAAAEWQRFWLVLDWGTEPEREELLDVCRQRAYWGNELRWRGALTLLLARTGYAEEAGREFDVVIEHCLNGMTTDADWLDIMTNIGEAAAILGDAKRCRLVYGALGRSSGTTTVVGQAWVCKGSTARVLGLLAAVIGRPAEADRYLGVAMDKHRDMEALPLLARTCAEWGRALVGRNNRDADEYLDEAFELATRLRMTDLALGAQSGLDSLRHRAAS